MKRLLFLASLAIAGALIFAPIDAPRVDAQTFPGQPSPQYLPIGQGAAPIKWLPITGCSLTSPAALTCPYTSGSVPWANITSTPTTFTGYGITGGTLTGDVLFKSGRPWVDVRAYGAVGDGVTDDTTAIQNAINAAISGGTVYFPLGNYCVKTSGGISVTTAGLWLVGPSNDSGTSLTTCSADVNLLTLNADSVVVRNMALNGAGLNVSANHNVITLGTSCVRCQLVQLDIAGGYYNIANTAPYTFFDHLRTNNAHGPAVINNITSASSTPGFFMRDSQVDQNWPVSVPSNLASVSAWASTHAYSSGNVVSNSGYYIQESAATCTSGGSAPTNLDYGSTISDGTCTWKLVAPTTFDAILLDTGTINVDIVASDFTGPYTNGVHLKNSLAGTGPLSVILRDFNTWSGIFTADVNAESGSILNIHDGQMQNGVLTNHVGIWLQSGFTGNYVVNNMTMLTFGTSGDGVLDQAGASNGGTISNNRIYTGGGTGISIGANINNRAVIGNHAGLSSLGSNAACIFVSPGTGDYLNITGNDCNGATSSQLTVTSVTGLHNSLCNNGVCGSAWSAGMHIDSVPVTVNFGSAGDTALPILLPPGFTATIVTQIVISNCTASIGGATYGVNTATGGGGTALVAAGTAGPVTATTINTAANAVVVNTTNINSQSYTPVNGAFQFRVGTTTVASCLVYVSYKPAAL